MSDRVWRYVVADVFTDTPLEGNPVAVFLEADGMSGETMQRLARELNLSETVFLLAPEPADPVTPGARRADARARIFTPTLELSFAGHPVLGTAFVLAARSGADTITLACGIGPIEVTLRRRDGRLVDGEMGQPVPPHAPFGDPATLLSALGRSGSGLPIEVYDNGARHVYVECGSAAEVSALRPDLGRLEQLGAYGVSCFALDGPGRVRTRMFGPGVGVAEDPATGSAAGPLAVHLARHGQTGFGEWIEIRQGAEIGRPSHLRVRAEGTPDAVTGVRVAGAAVEVAAGEFRLP
jgi:trans-2,3-dihydro-3-hydroxyanthranilate isomerase